MSFRRDKNVLVTYNVNFDVDQRQCDAYDKTDRYYIQNIFNMRINSVVFIYVVIANVLAFLDITKTLSRELRLPSKAQIHHSPYLIIAHK